MLMTKAHISRLLGFCYQTTSIYLCRPEFNSKYDEKLRRYEVDDEFISDLEQIVNNRYKTNFKIRG